MKTPIWEVSQGALAALLNQARGLDLYTLGNLYDAGNLYAPGITFVKAQLYTFTLQGGGGTISITDADLDITVPTLGTWDAHGLRVDVGNSRSTAHWKRGLDVDDWNVTIAARPLDPITGETYPDKIGDTPFVNAVAQGALDGADVTVDRAYFAQWPQPWYEPVVPVGVLRLFAGTPGEVDVGDLTAAIKLQDYRLLLQTQTPTGVFQAGCRHTLFDPGCTLTAATFAKNGTCVGGSTRKLIESAVTAPTGSGTFTLGRIVMTSGANDGVQRSVRRWTAPVGAIPGSFALLNPLPYDVAPGDTFTAYPGCNKSQANCTAFANSQNFGGTPFIPAAETAI